MKNILVNIKNNFRNCDLSEEQTEGRLNSYQYLFLIDEYNLS